MYDVYGVVLTRCHSPSKVGEVVRMSSTVEHRADLPALKTQREAVCALALCVSADVFLI